MSKQLSPDDRRAVDLLLDRVGRTSGASDGQTFVPPGDVQPQRVSAAEKVLNLLQAMPADEPADDLLSRTMRLVDEARAASTPAIPSDALVIPLERPIA